MVKIISFLFVTAVVMFPASAFPAAQTDSFSVLGYFNPNYPTYSVASTDTSTLLTTLVGSSLPWNKVRAVWITVETNDIRMAFGTDAVNSGTVVGHVVGSGQSVRIPNGDMVKQAKIISKTAGSAATLQVTVEWTGP